MKLAIIGDEISQGMDEVLATMASCDFRGLELRSVWDTPPHKLTDEQVRLIRDMCAASGVEVVGFDSPAGKAPLVCSDQALRDQQQILARSVEIAVALDAGFVRVFSFYRENDPEPRRAAELFQKLLTGVDLGGRDLLVETGMRTNTPSVPLTCEFLDAVGHEHVGILWDPGNSVYSGLEPDPFPRDWEAGRERIRHVHVKDPEGSREYVRLGAGDLNWPALLQRLNDDGYAGWFSLETHWRQDRVLSQPERDQPWGESFSRGGVDASTECMRALADMSAGLSPGPSS